MNILILNWRDIKNPAGGGAEILTHEMAKRWVKWGNRVTQFSSKFPGAQENEIIDGVRFIRKGQWWNVHILAFFYYFLSLKNNTDVVIDEVHWFPFFSKVYNKKTVLLACEVAKNLFPNIFSFPLSAFWRSIEKIYVSYYRNVPTLAISDSTKKDLVGEGFSAQNITVIPMGLSLPKGISLQKKEKNPTVIYLGRMNKQKGVEDVIDAFSKIHLEISSAKLWLVGSGQKDYLEYLKNKVTNLNMKNDTVFWGFVSEEKKFELLGKAHILLMPSVHEGWGLVIPEAGYMGTPSVAYDVSGSRDVIQDEKTGLLAYKNPSDLASKTVRLLRDKNLYQLLQHNAIVLAKVYNWDNTARIALQVLENL
ncbi:MAG TPA: glycosyltransferase family 4 protein [Candidatus Saccharimonadales bacterium]|nr:glycosyltransferase family 4 protein [Candidatus Saccharimonadales bacterium]